MMMMRRPVLLLLLLLPHGLFRPSARSRCPLPRCRSPVQSRHDRGGVVGEGGGSISRDGEERRCNDSGGGEVGKKKEWRKLWEGRRKEKQEERKEESRLSEKKPGKGVRSGREEGPCTKARERTKRGRRRGGNRIKGGLAMNRRLAHLPSLPYMLGRADMGEGIPSIAFAPCFLLLSAPSPHTQKSTTRKKGFGGNLNCGGIEGGGDSCGNSSPIVCPV